MTTQTPAPAECPCLRRMDLAGITPADYNPRSISAEALGRLTKSVAEFGNLSPVTLNVRARGTSWAATSG